MAAEKDGGTGTPEGQAMIELLWNPPPPPTRGPKQRLTLDRVVAAGIAVADRHGVAELSMRRVAQELGVGVMSLYTYVPGRDELFELMIDRAWGGRALPDRGLPWRTQIEFHVEQAWQMYTDHPWLIMSNLWRMPLGPHVLDVQEDLYRAVLSAGLDAHTAVRVTTMLEAHVFAATRSEIVDTSQSARTGVTADDYWASRAGFWTTYYSPERFPTMTRLWEAGAFDGDVAEADGESWRFGLRLLLDGVERLVAEGAGGGDAGS